MVKRKLRELGLEVLDMVFPRECIVTGELLRGEKEHRYFSDKAINEIIWARGPQCCKCGVPFDGEVVGERACPNCVKLNPVFDQGRTALLLKDAGRTLIHELKYRDGYYLWPDVSKLITGVPGYLDFIEGSVLVPVPLHPQKLRKRGFNQSFLFSQCLSRFSKCIDIQELIVRSKRTKTQTKLSREERIKNVKNAFALAPKVVINDKLKYTLVDDVFTTGATLNACAKILKKHGAREVNVITLGHG